MATIGRRYSSVLKDEDFTNTIAWDLDKAKIFKKLEDLGDVYDNILEVVQNALDSKEDPLTEPNEIHIRIPQQGDPNFGKYLLEVEDHGEGLTCDYKDKNIMHFLNHKKGDSPKAGNKKKTGQFGIAMIQ